MIQWIGLAIALLGFVWNGVKDYQKGDIKLPNIPHRENIKKPQYPIQYCLMAYDPNLDKVFYLHENGQWYDYAPQQRRYEATPQTQQYYQNQNQTTVGVADRTQGTQRYAYGQPSQAGTYTQRY